jgi:hypothetical protein
VVSAVSRISQEDSVVPVDEQETPTICLSRCLVHSVDERVVAWVADQGWVVETFNIEEKTSNQPSLSRSWSPVRVLQRL